MASKNLWGDLPAVEDLRLPIAVLREQAAVITDLTKGILVGSVNTSRRIDQISLTLAIVAPAIDNYTYDVAYASHSIQGYPVRLHAGWAYDISYDCKNEEAFEETLAEILRSPKLRSVIQALLAQSRAAE